MFCFFKTGSLIVCGSGRSRPNSRRTTGLATTIKAGTTTTTTARRRFHCGTPVTRPCVTTCDPAGEMWTEFCLNGQKRGANVPEHTSRNFKETTSCLFLHRCHQQDVYGPCGPPPPLSNLPGYDYNQLLLPRTPESAQIPGPPEYSGPPQTTSPGLVQISAVGPGVVWQYGGQQSTFSGVKPSNTDETNTRSMNPAKESNIRIISV